MYVPLTSESSAPWLLLVFSLPVKNASQRVQIWRKLQHYGTLPLRSSGHVLPNTAPNQERMEWLATAIRAGKGRASVIQVQDFDDPPIKQLQQMFIEARTRDYQKLLHELKKFMAQPPNRRPATGLNRLRRRFMEVTEIDFFENPLRARLENLLAQADSPEAAKAGAGRKRKLAEHQNRHWITRPRPGIDRVSSAWLIRRFIDPKARFVFGHEPETHPDAIPFDMFCEEGFGHRGEDCTFETLVKQFGLRDSKVQRIAEMIHDADLGDEKFGRIEGQGLDKALIGWAKQGLPDGELLQRGMDLIEGLYSSLK